MSLESFAGYISDYFLDVIGIYDQTYNQIFSEARPIKASVKEEAKVMEHPVETGATITDFKITLPVEIEIQFLLNSFFYRNVYENIKKAFLDSTLLVIQTRTGTYNNMLIQAMPHDEDPEVYDTVTLTVRLKEVIFAKTQESNYSPKRRKDSKTVDMGYKETNELPMDSQLALGTIGKRP